MLRACPVSSFFPLHVNIYCVLATEDTEEKVDLASKELTGYERK